MKFLYKIQMPVGSTVSDAFRTAIKLSAWCKEQGLKHEVDYAWHIPTHEKEFRQIHFVFEEESKMYGTMLVLMVSGIRVDTTDV